MEPLYLSQRCLVPEKETLDIIRDNFLNRFKNAPELYQFHHATSLDFNEVYRFAATVFDDPEGFTSTSMAIARHLYESSDHPKVKPGEVYVCLIDALPVEGRNYKALGIFKTENKSLFLQVRQQEEVYEMELQEGVEPSRIDKGCLIINQELEDGFRVMIFDNQNRGEEALFWKEKFLGVVPVKDEFHHTKHVLTLTKQFITEQLPTDQKVSRTDQIEMLTKSIDYFKSKESFDIEDFQKEVFANEEVIESFRSFGSRYIENNDFDIASNFDIHPEAVKKQARIYKNVIKLDKNFHIYVHGRTDLIEKGVDMDGRKYYKIYYQDEA